MTFLRHLENIDSTVSSHATGICRLQSLNFLLMHYSEGTLTVKSVDRNMYYTDSGNL